MSYYQRTLHAIAPDLNPAGVEALMRADHGTLCHLPRAAFVAAALTARTLAAMRPDYLRRVAEAEGMARDFAQWEALPPMPPTDPAAD